MSTGSSVNGYASGTAKGSTVPVAHLDYSYVSKCTDSKHLEEIILVLRSGTEGYYPALVEYTENKLREINPKSHVLRQDNPVQSFTSLDKKSREEVSGDLEDWTSQMKAMDSKLKVSAADVTNNGSLPPIRTVKKTQQENVEEPNNSSTKKTVKPRDYTEWDKFDINKELEEVDQRETVKKKSNNVTKKPVLETKPVVPKDLNKEERLLRAVKEKEKGNEAFKAQDFKEAVVYYSNSLSYEPTAASYNNRAAAELKLQKYSEAIEDCDMVLKMEPNNIKGFLRRGMAYKATKLYDLAVKDFNSILALDADNKRAKELLSEIEKLQRKEDDITTPVERGSDKDVQGHLLDDSKPKTKGQRLKIVEVNDTDEEASEGPGEQKNVATKSGKPKSKGQRLKIEEIDVTSEGVGTSDDKPDKASFEEKSQNIENGFGDGVNKDHAPDVETKGLDTRPSGEGSGEDNPGTKISNHADALAGNDVKLSDTSFSRDAGETEASRNAGTGGECQVANNSEVVAKTGDSKSNGVEPAEVSRDMAETGNEKEAAAETGNSESSGAEPTENSRTGSESSRNETDSAADVNKQDGCSTDTTVNDEQRQNEAAGTPAQAVPQLPEHVKSVIIEGQNAYKTGQYADAFQKFSEGVDLLWEDRELYPSDVALCLSNKAACCLKMGDCKECIRLCNLSLELVNDNTKVLIRRGSAYETLEKYAEAFHDFNRVRLLDGSNKFAQDHCSRVIRHLEMNHGKSWRKTIFELNRNGENEEQTFPITDKNKKTPITPTGTTHTQTTTTPSSHTSPMPSSTTPVASATAYEETNPLPQGKVPQFSPTSVPETTASECQVKEECVEDKQEKYLKLKDNGNTLVKQGKHGEAIHCYTDCIKLCPEEVAVYTNRALCYLQLNKYKEAEEDCSGALSIQEDNIKALFRRAKARKGMRKFRESSEDLVALLKIDSKNSSAKKELTEVLRLLKKERKETEKSSASKRKRILIKDVESDAATVPEASSVGSKNANSSSDIKMPKADKTESVKKNESKTTKVKNKMVPEASSAPAGNSSDMKTSKADNTETVKKNERTATTVKPNMKTAFQFFQTWKSVKKEDTEGYLNILKQVNLVDLSKVISNRLDADMIGCMFGALHLELKSKGDLKFVYSFLQKLQYVERFEMVLMFLSQAEKQVLSKLFDVLVEQNKSQAELKDQDVIKLRRKYCH